jgi:hypothetical protein
MANIKESSAEVAKYEIKYEWSMSDQHFITEFLIHPSPFQS